MPVVEVFDPPMCCSTGVCGPNPDTVLPRFAADLKWLRSQGVQVERHNLAQRPDAFAANEPVAAALDDRGDGCLPMVLVDGSVVSTERYPTREELADFVGMETNEPESIFSDAIAELVAIGAAVACNCDICLHYHHEQAEELGISTSDMAAAVEIGLMVKQVPHDRLMMNARRLNLVAQEDGAGGQSGGCCGG